ncbi:hypothetical protein BJY01DRAFT_242772 [Aspergillus pseudoustus]|uniref:Isoprenoid synthase domain-containing protein n=1 Tax=Aspergillus pseudoustus TaxID=1810923 RepID=A0ABR4KYU2_9EURO
MIRQYPELLPIAKATIPLPDLLAPEDERWTLEQILATYKALVAQDLGRLLEMVRDGDDYTGFYKSKVEFIHHTVRDFLRSSSDVKEQFETELEGEQRSTWMIACQAMLFVYKAVPYLGFQGKDLVRSMLFYASGAVSTKQAVPYETAVGWIDEVETLFTSHTMSGPNSEPLCRFFLCLDAQYGFHGRLKRQMSRHKKILDLNSNRR